MLADLLYAGAALTAINVLYIIGCVGKPRGPITPGVAALSTLFSAAWIVLLVIAAGRL